MINKKLNNAVMLFIKNLMYKYLLYFIILPFSFGLSQSLHSKNYFIDNYTLYEQVLKINRKIIINKIEDNYDIKLLKYSLLDCEVIKNELLFSLNKNEKFKIECYKEDNNKRKTIFSIYLSTNKEGRIDLFDKDSLIYDINYCGMTTAKYKQTNYLLYYNDEGLLCRLYTKYFNFNKYKILYITKIDSFSYVIEDDYYNVLITQKDSIVELKGIKNSEEKVFYHYAFINRVINLVNIREDAWYLNDNHIQSFLYKEETNGHYYRYYNLINEEDISKNNYLNTISILDTQLTIYKGNYIKDKNISTGVNPYLITRDYSETSYYFSEGYCVTISKIK